LLPKSMSSLVVPAAAAAAGTTRLDMLLGNNPQSRSRAETPPKQLSEPVQSTASRHRDLLATPTKRVSFLPDDESTMTTKTKGVTFSEDEATMPPAKSSLGGRVSFKEADDDSETISEDEDGHHQDGYGVDDNMRLRMEDIRLDNNGQAEDRVESEVERRDNSQERSEDPNVFLNEAENLLNAASMGMGKPAPSGHTPSVIGTQEIYRDPRQRRLQQEQEKKMSTSRGPDGSKLSFQEKMKLFAQEVGENTPKEKAKISKAQREIEDERRLEQSE